MDRIHGSRFWNWVDLSKRKKLKLKCKRNSLSSFKFKRQQFLVKSKLGHQQLSPLHQQGYRGALAAAAGEGQVFRSRNWLNKFALQKKNWGQREGIAGLLKWCMKPNYLDDRTYSAKTEYLGVGVSCFVEAFLQQDLTWVAHHPDSSWLLRCLRMFKEHVRESRNKWKVLLNPPNTGWKPRTESWDWLDAARRISMVISISKSNSSYKWLFFGKW